METPRQPEASKDTTPEAWTADCFKYLERFRMASALQENLRAIAKEIPQNDQKWEDLYAKLSQDPGVKAVCDDQNIASGNDLAAWLQKDLVPDERSSRIPPKVVETLYAKLRASTGKVEDGLWSKVRLLPPDLFESFMIRLAEEAPEKGLKFYTQLSLFTEKIERCKNAERFLIVFAKAAPEKAFDELLRKESSAIPGRLSALRAALAASAKPETLRESIRALRLKRMKRPTEIASAMLEAKPNLERDENGFTMQELDELIAASEQAVLRKLEEEGRKTLQRFKDKEALSPLRSINKKLNEDRMLEDPALAGVASIKDEWIPWDKAKESLAEGDANLQKLQYHLMIARSLYFQKLPVTEENVRAAFTRVLEQQKRYGNVDVFGGRNVIMAANNEKFRDTFKQENGQPYMDETYDLLEKDAGDPFNFGKTKVMDAFRARAGEGKSVTLIRPERTRESLINTKAATLKAIRTTPSPFTFVFDGHGDEEGLALDGGHREPGDEMRDEDCVISAKELAEAYADRAPGVAGDQGDPSRKDILILASCYSGNFVRAFQGYLGKTTPCPIVMGTSEYGQYSYSKIGSPYGSRTFTEVFGLDDPKAGTRLKDIQKRSLKGPSKTVIYAPDENGKPVQITGKPGEQPDRA